jgi:hypothetical protein
MKNPLVAQAGTSPRTGRFVVFSATLLVRQSCSRNAGFEKLFLGSRLPLRLFRRRVQQGGLAISRFLGKSQGPQPLCILVNCR